MISPQVIKEQTTPPLEGRQAKCQCGKVKPSSADLGMFEYRGKGSRAASLTCVQCGYYKEAHNYKSHHSFRPHGPYEFDIYWCGCGGAD